MTTDPREVRFLASQAERLAGNISKQQQQLRLQNKDGILHPDVASEETTLIAATTLSDHENDENIVTPNVDGGGMTTMTTRCSSKDVRYQFFSNFRKLCAEFRAQLNSLVVIPESLVEEFGTSSSTMTTTATDSVKMLSPLTLPTSLSSSAITIMDGDDVATVKEYYATSSKRRHVGRTKLDGILRNVRILQNHALSSTTSTTTTPLLSCSSSSSNSSNSNNELLLSSMIQSLQMETIIMTPTDIRLLTNEISNIIQHIDYIRDSIICPKDKFVFYKYRIAMMSRGERMMMDINNNSNTSTKDDDIINRTTPNTHVVKTAAATAAATVTHSNYNNHDGGILENLSNCTIVITANNTIQHIINDRNVAATTLASTNMKKVGEEEEGEEEEKEVIKYNQSTTTNEVVVGSSSSSSYLIQNMTNVTLLLHGTRPTIQLRNLQSCNIYMSNVTCGAVHVTQCHKSIIYCASYQLRIHDSTDLQFGLWVRSGPIIENCTNIVFAGNYYDSSYFNSTTTTTTTTTVMSGGGDVATAAAAARGGNDVMLGRNMFYDGKDFNWLRTLHKSPNFSLVSTLPSTSATTTIDTIVKEGTTHTDIVSVDNDEESSIMVVTNGRLVTAMDGTDSYDEL